MAMILGMVAVLTAPANAHPDPGDGHTHDEIADGAGDLSAALLERDASSASVISSGPNAKVIKNLDVVGRGERNVLRATTDVWAHDGYAYTGTFQSPCGGDPEAGIWVWDVHNPNKPEFVTIIQSPAGSRTNDVRVDSMNSGDILVHSNEACAGGPGGFEIFNVDDPENPVYLASVTINESDLNSISPLFFAPGSLDDVGVHNLWLFTQGDKDYVAATSEGAFDNFRIYDISDPGSPTLVSGWGAEELVPGLPAGVDDYSDLTLVTDPGGAITLNALLDLFSGFGASQNKFLHDVTISADGTMAYLANWDAGLVLLDISDPANPQVVSVAIDPVNGSLDGEVNSHSVWPSEDGTIVVEGEEDFAPFSTDEFRITSGVHQGVYPSELVGGAQAPAILPDLTLNGPVVYGGYGCPDSAPIPSPGDIPGYLDMIGAGEETIVVLQRGPVGDPSAPEEPCFPGEKAHEAVVAGWDAVLFVQQHGGSEDPPFCGSGAFVDPVVGICTNHEAFHRLFDTEPFVSPWTYPDGPEIGQVGDRIEVGSVPNAWSGLRIWDYSDPTSPVLASLFDTVCSANPIDPSCDPAGTYSVHNVQVETRGNKVLAYVSWYSDGMLVLDVTDPYNPVEVARYVDNSPEGNLNDGLANDFWGVYKEENSPFFYGSDRNGGLYVFKEKGSGSGK